MRRWYVLLDGPASDLAHLQRLFTASGFEFGEMDEKAALSAPQLEPYKNSKEVIDVAMELLAAINVALRISVPQYTGFLFHALIEKLPDGSLNRTMFSTGAAYGIAGVAGVGVAGAIGAPARTKEERLVSLIAKNEAIADLAVAMTAKPLTWGAMNTVYESVKGLMSTETNIEAKRADFQGLIDRGWITLDESTRFYKSAADLLPGIPSS